MRIRLCLYLLIARFSLPLLLLLLLLLSFVIVNCWLVVLVVSVVSSFRRFVALSFGPLGPFSRISYSFYGFVVLSCSHFVVSPFRRFIFTSFRRFIVSSFRRLDC